MTCCIKSETDYLYKVKKKKEIFEKVYSNLVFEYDLSIISEVLRREKENLSGSAAIIFIFVNNY